MPPFLLAHPAVAWFLPAILLPVIFHLFFRLKKAVQDFPSLLFFHRIDPRLSAKRKVHAWLLLFLRCLFIALVVLALMRPGTPWGGGTGGATARIILIDNSASMSGAGADGVPKLTLAARTAEAWAEATPTGDATAVQLMIPDPLAALPAGFRADAGALKEALSRLTPTDGAADVPEALRRALALLETARQPVREIDLLTDLRASRWNRGAFSPEAGLPPRTRIVVHRIATAPLTTGAVALSLAEAPAASLPVGHPARVRLALRNVGPVPALVHLNTTDDTGKATSRDFSVGAGESLSVVAPFSFPSAGFHWARAWVEGDVAPGGGQVTLGFNGTDPRKVLFVGGRKAFAALPYAVSPGGGPGLSGLDATDIAADKLAAALADPSGVASVVLVWDAFPQDAATVKALETFVRQGGTLALIPSPGSGGSAGHPLPPWLEAEAAPLKETPAGTDPEALLPLQADDPLWRDLRDADGRPKLGPLRVFRYRPLTLGKAWQPLLATSGTTGSGGAPVFARRSLGKGTLWTSGIAFTPQDSSLPLKPGFVVFVQAVLSGNDTQLEGTPVQSRLAGETLRFPSEALVKPASIRSLAGASVAWQGQPRDFGPVPRAGILEIRQSQNDRTTWAAVSSAAEEAGQEFLGTGPIPFLKPVPHEVVAWNPDDRLASGSASTPGQSSQFLYGWLLTAALLVLALETAVANRQSFQLSVQSKPKPKANP